MAPADRGTAIRFVPAPPVEVVVATDLGSVAVLKHGNLYLLTDQFGDIHPDTRGLGLYEGDTRLLSCALLRVNGYRPAILQAPVGGAYEDAIELTNPEPRRDLGAKLDPLALVHRSIGIRRERVVAGLLRERVRLVNYAEGRARVELTLDLAADLADIFEVRGWPRSRRGTHLPIALHEGLGRVVFRYDGLDGVRRLVHVALDGNPSLAPTGDGTIRATWRWSIPSGGERQVEWHVWSERQQLGGEAPGAVAGAATAGGEPSRAFGALGGEAGRPPTPEPGRALVPETRGGVALAEVVDETLGEPVAEAGAAEAAAALALFTPVPRVRDDEAGAAYRAWWRGATEVESDNELFNLTLQRSTTDLRLLVNDGPGRREWYLAAGIPWFVTLFGRDSIITALQVLAFRPQIAYATLDVLAARQATALDPERDAEPGKILHELRTGELAAIGELPHTPYYGSVDSTPLWLILLGATFDWTGDRALLDRLWPHALAALEWIDRWGDRDGDGFVEYERRNPTGLLNQGWKDSSDAVRDRHGRLVPTPIALVEVQGYVYDAKRRMAHLAEVRGETELAARLEREAAALRERFEAAFWVPDLRYYAMALDGEKRQADAITSNPGQALWTGIVSPERARPVADRLLGPGLYSGWGVRTYAAGQPGYNPIGYHTGTVWPHDTSLIAAGLKRYGLEDEANELISRVFEAAQSFPAYRLPELFCGFERDSATSPVPYPVACSPQAWAAGAPFLFLETMLGLRPHAERGELELLHPHLPSWLRSVRVRNLRVGTALVDLLFHSWRGTTSAEVLRKEGDIAVTIRL
ncbi:MAG TPA: glycogen debranching N-terminal domain-containing protein [Candidatus Binatia bacterium]|nr:glycogen debranching N-terminal domain-containing protein [Candidatus Binatia bacterium]